MEAREKKNTTEEFVTFVLSRMKLSTEHRKGKSKDVDKKIKDKTPTDFGPEDITVHTRSEGPTVQLGMQMDQWRIFFGDEAQGKIGQVQKTLHSWWKRKVAKPIRETTSRENTIRKQTTGLSLARKDGQT